MIRAALNRNSHGLYTGYSAKGHSGYAEEGSDIICAAVSVLGATCINALESVCGIESVIDENSDGALAFHLPQLTDEQQHDAQILMGALHQGLSDIAEQFPQYIHLSIMNGGKHND